MATRFHITVQNLTVPNNPIKIVSSHTTLQKALSELKIETLKFVRLIFGCNESYEEISRAVFKEGHKDIDFKIFGVHNKSKQTYKIIHKKKTIFKEFGYLYNANKISYLLNKVAIVSIIIQ